MTEKKNQHFVPQVHLRGFAIENASGKSGAIWEYDKQCPDVPKRKSIKKAVCCKPFYYDQIGPDESRNQAFEDALGKVEDTAAKIIQALYEKRSLENKGKLAFYIALLLCRGPAFRDGCHTWLAECVGDVDVFPQASLPLLVQAASQISESLCRKKWEFFFSSGEDCFVTSDTPVIFGLARGEDRAVGPGHRNALVWCPLRKDLLVGIRPYCDADKNPYDISSASTEMVGKINHMMCFAAQRYVYGPVEDKQIIAHVGETEDWRQTLSAFSLGGAATATWSTCHRPNRNTPVPDGPQPADGHVD